MSLLSGEHRSFWVASTLPSSYPSLEQDVSVDVAIVGGGLVGITAAKLLKQAGKTVAVIEADRIASGVSGHTTAKLTALHQLIYADLVEEVGTDKAQVYADSNQAAIEKVSALVQAENIDCDFSRQDAYTFARTQDNVGKIEAEVKAASKLGLPVDYVSGVDLPFEIAGAIKLPNQAQFHPRKYILHLAGTLAGEGSHVFEQTRVITVNGENPCRVMTEHGGTVIAQDVIIATNLPILDQGLFFAKSYPKRSYLIGAYIDPTKAPTGMFIGIGQTYRSIRTTPTDDGRVLLLMGGEGHKVGDADDTNERYQRLVNDLKTDFGVDAVDYRWSSQDMVSFDKLPYIGRLTPMSNHTYVATGFSHWGMSKSILSAMILSDLILGKSNPWADTYDAIRPTPFVSQTSIKQNLDVGSRWVGDRFKGLFESEEDIQSGDGKLITISGEKVAAYRDDTGNLHKVSPVCPHLGCIVDWNAAEKSWDCPCHGSRFSYGGDILQGPAVKCLASKSEVNS
ncbi:MAG: FAD-dependent oxidoreductase [Cyanobacteria bacterium P01_A01_bin.37]